MVLGKKRNTQLYTPQLCPENIKLSRFRLYNKNMPALSTNQMTDSLNKILKKIKNFILYIKKKLH